MKAARAPGTRTLTSAPWISHLNMLIEPNVDLSLFFRTDRDNEGRPLGLYCHLIKTSIETCFNITSLDITNDFY